MEIIRAVDTHQTEDGETFSAYEYPTEDEMLNIARIELSGRYPKQGAMRNREVKEIVYVESGQGKVAIDGIEQEIEKGDVIFYEKGEEVYWEGMLSLIIVCTPKWTASQHEFLL